MQNIFNMLFDVLASCESCICIYQVFAYVSQAHKVVLPEDLVDHETLTLEQVIFFLTFMIMVTPKAIEHWKLRN